MSILRYPRTSLRFVFMIEAEGFKTRFISKREKEREREREREREIERERERERKGGEKETY